MVSIHPDGFGRATTGEGLTTFRRTSRTCGRWLRDESRVEVGSASGRAGGSMGVGRRSEREGLTNAGLCGESRMENVISTDNIG